MKSPKFWIAVLVTGIVVTALDYVVHGQLLTHAYYSKIESIRQDTNIGPFVFGDFVAVLVLAWVLNRLGSVFGPGLKGGLTAGLVLGVLVNFPTYHFVYLMFKGVPYPLAWIWTIYGIVWYAIAGAILTALTRKAEAASAPAPAG